MKESIAQREILETLYQIPKSIVLRNNNTPIFDPKLEKFRKFNSKFQPPGVSDIFFIFKGKFWAIEVKTFESYKYLMNHYDEVRNGFFSHKSRNSTEKKKARLQAQINFIENVKRASGGGFFTFGVEDCREKLKI